MAQLNDCGTHLGWAEARGKSASQTANRKQGVSIFETDSRSKDAASFAGGDSRANREGATGGLELYPRHSVSRASHHHGGGLSCTVACQFY
jgi:hypothetical protein